MKKTRDMNRKNAGRKFGGAKAACVMMLSALALYPQATFAAFGDSALARGTLKLLQDVSVWLIVAAGVVGGVAIVYFAIRRAGADEMDQKMWGKRIATAIVSTVIAILGTSILAMVVGYYQ
jgi:heme/copper-type cytochrome/quinol oxidase subunit 2